MENYIFDLYGTLADIHTDEQSPKFLKAMQKRFGADFSERYKSLCLSLETGEEYCEIDLIEVFKQIQPQSPQSAADFFRTKSRSKLKTYGGVRKLLSGLKARGAKLYLLSNAQACFTVNELKKLKIYNFFDGIELSSDFGRKKPSCEFFEHLISKYSLARESSVYVGNDYNCDILGAKAAGLKTAYIKSNCSPATDSLENIIKVADFATDNFRQLSDYLFRSEF